MTATQTPTQINLNIVPAFLPLYESMYDSRIRYFFLWGGRGGAKSLGIGDLTATAGVKQSEKILCLREIQNSIKQSSHALLKGRIEAIGYGPFYEILETVIKSKINGTEILFSGLSTVTEDQIKSFYEVMRAWVEEAQSITDRSLKILLPTIRAEGSQIYFTYNRKKILDPVHKLFTSYPTKRERMQFTDEHGDKYYWTLYRCSEAIGIEINYDGNPFFPEVLEKERARDELNLHADEYNHIWLGKPEPQPKDSILSADLIKAAMSRTPDGLGTWSLGVDVARNGKDGVEIAVKRGLAITEIREYKNPDPSHIMRIHDTGRRVLAALPFDDPEIPIMVDDTGLGGGLTDWLIEKGYNAIGVNFQQSAQEPDKYVNAISEMWFNFLDIADQVSLPFDMDLLEDLTNRAECARDNRGRRSVEPKAIYKAKTGRSPDKADAVLLACYNKVINSGEVFTTLKHNIF